VQVCSQIEKAFESALTACFVSKFLKRGETFRIKLHVGGPDSR
jgi:hypothetical protein